MLLVLLAVLLLELILAGGYFAWLALAARLRGV